MTRSSTVPLGVDIGTARVRVAQCEVDRQGALRLIAVATRGVEGDASAALRAAWTDLATTERRCVLALALPDAMLRTASFPAHMTGRERERAARFEAARHAPDAIAACGVRVVALPDGRCALGIVRREALEAKLATVRRAKLRPVAVDDAAFALLRAFRHADAIVDVGETGTLLVVPGDPLPAIHRFASGGGALTGAIAAALGIDRRTAEQRKRTVGMAGAGEAVHEELVGELARALVEERAAGRRALRSLCLTGNGARLPGLADALARAAALPVAPGALPRTASDVLPADVVRSASMDWALAYGLAMRSAVR